MRRRQRKALVALAPWFLAQLAIASPAVVFAGWNITPRGSISLAVGAVAGVRELSGVAYIGPSGGGMHQFAAIQDSGNQFVLFDLDVAANGQIELASAVDSQALSPGADYEGIAYAAANGSLFVAEETLPGVHEHSLTTGERLRSVTLPAAFQSDVFNKSLESFTRSEDGTVMWTANEEALSIDGPIATAASGTNVRLQRILDHGDSLTADAQFVYRVEPIHSGTNPDRSGLVDMVLLPDDTLIALERSAAGTLPPFRNSIYQIDLASATDVSGSPFDLGLASGAFTPVGKTLLWSGQAGGALGSNLEGLALGPTLASGNWLLVGVVDNGGSGSSTIVSFELSLSGCSIVGDYNCSGTIDRADYKLWKSTYGSPLALAADGNGDAVVSAADYTVWRNSLGAQVSAGGSADTEGFASVPEPRGVIAWVLGVAMSGTRRRRRQCQRATEALAPNGGEFPPGRESGLDPKSAG